jgi:hypothetical protein
MLCAAKRPAALIRHHPSTLGRAFAAGEKHLFGEMVFSAQTTFEIALIPGFSDGIEG